MKSLFGGLAAAVLAVTTGCSTTNNLVSDDKGATSEVLTQYQTAESLAKLSRKNKDAMGLGVAASILKGAELSSQKLDAKKVSDSKDSGAKKATASITSETLKKEALALATPAEKKLIEARFSGIKTRGRDRGPAVIRERVQAKETDRYEIRFMGGEKAMVYVSGDGDTDLDLYIYDENGNKIDSDIDNDDECLCEFTPRWTGIFTIRVKNRGNVYNNYKLAVN